MQVNKVYEGDCLEVMRGLPDNCIDTIITDPPYGLSDQKGASLEERIIDIFFDVVFPDYYNIYSQFKTDFKFVGPFNSVAFLDFMDRTIWKKSRVTMPKCSVNFNANTEVWDKEINNSGKSAVGFSDGILPNEINAESIEFSGDYFFNIRPSIDFTFSNGNRCCFRQLGPGLFSVPVIIPLDSDFAGFLCSLSPSDSGFFGDIVRFFDGTKGETETPTFIMTRCRTKIIVILSFDLRRGTIELLPTDRTDHGNFFFELVTPKNIRTFSATSRLSAVFQPVSFSFIGDTANRAISIYFHKDIITEINKNRKGFMGKNWDYGIPGIAYWREALRVAKPGATLMAFGGTRTHHRLMCAIEDAGWEIRDCIMWIYGSGFPKSLDIGKALDKQAVIDCPVCNGKISYPIYRAICPTHGEIEPRLVPPERYYCSLCDERLDDTVWIINEPCGNCGGTGKVKGAEREVVGFGDVRRASQSQPYGQGARQDASIDTRVITAPATPQAQEWDGWGTALKPAYEPIVVAMNPNEGSYADNALKWKVAGLNIDGGRIETEDNLRRKGLNPLKSMHNNNYDQGYRPNNYYEEDKTKHIWGSTKGRWPANVIHDGSEEVEAEFAKAGVSVSRESNYNWEKSETNGDVKLLANYIKSGRHHNDTGTPSRFFYTAKASPSERGAYNNHPTVKSLELLKYLARLTKTPTGGLILDPFAGSGTTALAAIAEGRDYILIEKEPEYCAIINRRIAEYTGEEIEVKEIELTESESVKQLSLW